MGQSQAPMCGLWKSFSPIVTVLALIFKPISILLSGSSSLFDLQLPFDDLMHHLRLSFENWDYKIDGGESLNDIKRRVLRALKKIAQSDFERPIVTAHGNLIAAVLGAIDPDFEFEQWRAMKNPHLYCLLCAGDAPVLFEDLD